MDKKTKQDPYICCLQKTYLLSKNIHRLKVKGWKKLSHANGMENKAEAAVLVSDKINIETKAIVRDEDRHCIMTKATMQQQDISVVHINAPNIGAPKYVKETLTDLNGEIDRNAVIFGDLTTPLASMDRSSTWKINNDAVALSDTLDQMDLTDIFRAFHPKATEYTWFSKAHGTYSRIDNLLGHKQVSIN